MDRFGQDECLKKIRAVKDMIGSSETFYQIKPVYDYVLFRILEFYDDFSHDGLDSDEWYIELFGNQKTKNEQDHILTKEYIDKVFEMVNGDKQIDESMLEDMTIIHEICSSDLHDYETYFFDDADFLPEYLDSYVAAYIEGKGNREGIYMNILACESHDSVET